VLAHQVYEVLRVVGDPSGVRVSLQVGGAAYGHDKQSHVVVGTPGRMADMISKGSIPLKDLRLVVLDEADEMLTNSKLLGQVQECVRAAYKASADIQTCLFSATMPTECVETTKEFLKDGALHLLLPQENVTVAGIKQYFVDCVEDRFKLDSLCSLYEHFAVAQCVVFVNSQNKCEQLQAMMAERDFSTSVIHGGLDNNEQNARMKEFRTGSSRVMIATDLMARGIDVQQVSLVINYDLPTGVQGREQYVHRIGRGGRMGRQGLAINLVTKKDRHLLTEIAEFWQCQIDEIPDDMSNLI